VRVWDVSPGYLNRWSLLSEHREVHAVFVIITQGKKGYAHHPETLRWRGHLPALIFRHDLLVSEMELRGYGHHTPLAGEGPVVWPGAFVDSPGSQLALLGTKYIDRPAGRIPLPSGPQELWAQHKYSVLARDPELYRRLGSELAQGAATTETLACRLVACLRQSPPYGRLRNALQHMWGYVKEHASEVDPSGEDLPQLLGQIRRLAMSDRVTYLEASTALVDLDVWLART
jgi:hypothetical protein